MGIFQDSKDQNESTDQPIISWIQIRRGVSLNIAYDIYFSSGLSISPALIYPKARRGLIRGAYQIYVCIINILRYNKYLQWVHLRGAKRSGDKRLSMCTWSCADNLKCRKWKLLENRMAENLICLSSYKRAEKKCKRNELYIKIADQGVSWNPDSKSSLNQVLTSVGFRPPFCTHRIRL